MGAAGCACNVPLPVAAHDTSYYYRCSCSQKIVFRFSPSSSPSPPALSTELNGRCQVRDGCLESYRTLNYHRQKPLNEEATLSFTHKAAVIETNPWRLFCLSCFIMKGSAWLSPSPRPYHLCPSSAASQVSSSHLFQQRKPCGSQDWLQAS